MKERDRLFLVGGWSILGGGCAEFSERASGERDAVRVVDQAVQNRIAESGIADAFVPVLDRHLAGEECRAAACAIFDHLQKITSFAVADRGEALVVED